MLVRLLLIIGVLFNSPLPAGSNINYADLNPGGNKYVLLIDVGYLTSKKNKISYLTFVNSIFSNLQKGDYVAVEVMLNDGSTQTLIKVSGVPGCPDPTFAETIFGSDCNGVLAKKHYYEFKVEWEAKVYHLARRTTGNRISTKLIDALKDIHGKYSELKNPRLMILSDMHAISDILDFDGADKNDYDAAYVDIVTREMLPDMGKFKIKIYSHTRDDLLYEFWSDVFLTYGVHNINVKFN